MERERRGKNGRVEFLPPTLTKVDKIAEIRKVREGCQVLVVEGSTWARYKRFVPLFDPKDYRQPLKLSREVTSNKKVFTTSDQGPGDLAGCWWLRTRR